MTTFSITCLDASNDKKPTIRALAKTLESFKVAGKEVSTVYWFSDQGLEGLPCRLHWIRIPPFVNWFDDYCLITLKLCPHIVMEDFNVIIHADGFAVNPEAWTDEFLEYDYLGAIFYPQMIVGGGGFSMRSRRLYDQLLRMKMPYSLKQMEPYLLNQPKLFVDLELIRSDTGTYSLAEDQLICRVFRQQIEHAGIKFAPLELADRWSIEHHLQSPWLGKSFGFHGKHGIAQHYGITL
jgi:hypothetical protein